MQVSNTSNNLWLQYQQSITQTDQTTQANSAGGQTSTGDATSGGQAGGLASLLTSTIQSPSSLFSSGNLSTLISAQANTQAGDIGDGTDPTQAGSTSGTGSAHHHHHHGGGEAPSSTDSSTASTTSGATATTTAAASTGASDDASASVQSLVSQILGAA
jgi:hypothetical protein